MLQKLVAYTCHVVGQALDWFGLGSLSVDRRGLAGIWWPSPSAACRRLDSDLCFLRTSHSIWLNERLRTQLKNSSQCAWLIRNRAQTASKTDKWIAKQAVIGPNNELLPRNIRIRAGSRPGFEYVELGNKIDSLSSAWVNKIFNAWREKRPQSPAS